MEETNPTPQTEPKSAIPSHLTNGNSLHSQPSHNVEREQLINSIMATNKKREVVEFDLPSNGPKSPQTRRRSLHPSDERNARDPRDEAKSPGAVSAPRPESPITKLPTVDFDGLSWPSE
jgi:hypothetical protein